MKRIMSIIQSKSVIFPLVLVGSFLLMSFLALAAMAMGMAWIAERIAGKDIFLSKWVNMITANSILFVAGLCVLSMICLLFFKPSAVRNIGT